MLRDSNCAARRCKHFQGPTRLEEDSVVMFYVCKAFPDYPGIPTSITAGFELHEKVFEGQDEFFRAQKNDIIYEKKD